VPQIIVEFSSNIGGQFDHRGLAQKIHSHLVSYAGAELDACKTRLNELRDFLVGDGSSGAMLHVGINVLAGRSQMQKTALANAVMSTALELLATTKARPLQVTVAVADLPPDNYHKAVIHE